MATIRKRNDKWQVQVRRKGFPAVSRSFDQQRDAERWGVLKEREFDKLESQGRLGARVCDLSLAELLDRYRTTALPAKRGGAREAYMVAALARTPFCSLRADKVTPREIASYRDTRLKAVAPATIVRELGLLQHAYELARKNWGFEGLVNPVIGVQRPPLPRGRCRRLTADEEDHIRSVAATCRNPLLLPIMTLALETSMRLGEIVAARWEHYDADARVLLLPMTKNGKPRTIPLSRLAVKTIEEQTSASQGEVFPTTAEAIKRAWIRLMKRANINDLHFHDLRHEAISRLVEKGFDLPSVMMFTGHSDHRMLLRYTHLNARSLVERLDQVENSRNNP